MGAFAPLSSLRLLLYIAAYVTKNTGVNFMSFFNGKGEMNAGSVKDALNTLVKYAAILEENQPSNSALAGQPSLNDEKRDELISRAIMTQEGKLALSQAMGNPIR
jgi:hypothetical protein